MHQYRNINSFVANFRLQRMLFFGSGRVVSGVDYTPVTMQRVYVLMWYVCDLHLFLIDFYP